MLSAQRYGYGALRFRLNGPAAVHAQGPAMIFSSIRRLSTVCARSSSVSPAALIRPTYGKLIVPSGSMRAVQPRSGWSGIRIATTSDVVQHAPAALRR